MQFAKHDYSALTRGVEAGVNAYQRGKQLQLTREELKRKKEKEERDTVRDTARDAREDAKLAVIQAQEQRKVDTHKDLDFDIELPDGKGGTITMKASSVAGGGGAALADFAKIGTMNRNREAVNTGQVIMNSSGGGGGLSGSLNDVTPIYRDFMIKNNATIKVTNTETGEVSLMPAAAYFKRFPLKEREE
jgi:hypothetical protein